MTRVFFKNVSRPSLDLKISMHMFQKNYQKTKIIKFNQKSKKGSDSINNVPAATAPSPSQAASSLKTNPNFHCQKIKKCQF